MTDLDPARLGMRPHPEGGWFRETWRHPETVPTPRGERALATCVAFLLQPGQESTWHRVASDELWLWQGGGPMLLSVGGPGPRPANVADVELSSGGQHLVPAGCWQAARPAQGASLVACVVSPGFDFADFELLDS